MQLCGIDVPRANVQIVAAGEVPVALDVPKYVPHIPNYQAEIQSQEPAWVFELRGEQRLLSGAVMTDPTCLVVGNDSGFIATGGGKDAAGNLVTPLPGEAQQFSLPSPAP